MGKEKGSRDSPDTSMVRKAGQRVSPCLSWKSKVKMLAGSSPSDGLERRICPRPLPPACGWPA